MVERVIISSGAKGYFFTITNAQGDVIGIRNSTGAVIARYNYDAFGKLISITDDSGNILTGNSFATQINVRYRGYYYDSETGLYYLQSRYYDPETGRFLNADDVNYLGATKTLLSYNAFAYCENDPVNKVDPSGHVSRRILQKIFDNYKTGLFNTSELFTSLALLNSGNPYLAFHEFVQVIIATKLSRMGIISYVELEKPCKYNKKREIDIYAYSDQRRRGINYIWEVKPVGQSSAAHRQINEYLKLNDGFIRGFKIGTVVKQIMGEELKVRITSDKRGGIYYSFYNSKGKRISNAELYNKVKQATNIFWASLAGTTALVAGGTLLLVSSGGTAAPVASSVGGKILAFATSSTANSIGKAAMFTIVFMAILSKL